jgi:hypothetical protein
MIVVTRITGESLNLQNGKEIPSAIVLSNGNEEVHVQVSADVVAEVVRLFTESVEAPVPIRQSDPPPLATVEEDDHQQLVNEGPGAEYADPATGTESI